MIDFSEPEPNARLSITRAIPQSAIRACPHLIIAPEHYRGNLTCRCDDPTHAEMADWGYDWDANAERWIAPPETANGG